MDGINSWWEGRAGERFWLAVTRPMGSRKVLAGSCGSGRGIATGPHPLVRHVRDGDAVFHFDQERQAIVAQSTSRGRPRRCRPSSSGTGHGLDPEKPGTESLLSRALGLERSVALDDVVSLEHIARIQFDLFPALRTLDDSVGESLHYPFALGSPVETHLLAGHVFKLPALFVAACPTLADAACSSRPEPQRRGPDA